MDTAISLDRELPTEFKLETEDSILAYAQTMRKHIVKDLMKAGTPTDPDNIKVILGALKDMDGQALNRKRIKVEEKQTDIQAQSASLIARVLAETSGGDFYKATEGLARVIPVLPKHIPDPILVEGETTDVVVNSQTYDSFTARFTPDD